MSKIKSNLNTRRKYAEEGRYWAPPAWDRRHKDEPDWKASRREAFKLRNDYYHPGLAEFMAKQRSL